MSVDPSPFTYQGYTLYSTEVELGGTRRRVWFFAKQQPRSAVPAAKPVGYRVVDDPRGGVPFLRPDGPWMGHRPPLRDGAPGWGPALGHQAS
jgi:hypothetical protein